MIRFIKDYIVDIVIILVVAVLIGASIFMMKGIDGARKYDCDVHIISLNTNISVNKDGENYSKIDGNIFRIVEDPLTMTIDEHKVAYAGDAYHFINQDSHTIYLNNEFAVEMAGELSVFGNNYTLYNKEGEKIGRAHFNFLDTYGYVYDVQDNVIAKYTSALFFKDYKVFIVDNDVLSDDAILMIVASYVSDKNYDNN